MTAPYEALNRLCLNNWHYIDRKILKFHKEMNFFTGHSGSGKSTVIDALQILLYANTDGRGFFNKAATDESDRTLMEYLRGMVSVDDNNSYTYLRNEDFSSTIVMENWSEPIPGSVSVSAWLLTSPAEPTITARFSSGIRVLFRRMATGRRNVP